MSTQRGLVLDANILLRAVFGRSVWRILQSTNEEISLCCPDQCIREALRNIPMISERRGVAVSRSLREIEDLIQIVEPVDFSAYSAFRASAMQRIGRRDPDDWPVVAVSLMLQLPIWTEDLDFFGIGIATWTSDRVELYFKR